jgi:hypothetical protein
MIIEFNSGFTAFRVSSDKKAYIRIIYCFLSIP